MKRRDALKNLTLGSLGLLTGQEALSAPFEGVAPLTENAEAPHKPAKVPPGRTREEAVRDEKLLKERFFSASEMTTLSVLCDIILPADAVSGSATHAGVPAFIEFMAKDQPQHQTPLRGGLMWLDTQCKMRFGRPFAGCSSEQQLAMTEDIAYPKQATPAMQPGAAFFTHLRNLVLTGFYTTQMGFHDLGYVGNLPNVWKGVPEDALKEASARNIRY